MVVRAPRPFHQDAAMSDTVHQQVKVVGWARVYPALQRAVSKNLRRGAWYPVVRNELPDRVSIKMGARTVDVPRRLLEVRRERPLYFSVISRVADRTHVHDPQGLERHYGVCPLCSYRVILRGRPERKRCPRCKHEGDVGWWEG